MEVSIIIPNFNGRTLLEKNIPEVIKSLEEKKNKIKEIIVVDDGSKDDSVSFLQEEYKKQVKLIKHTKNRGFSAAINTGVRSSSGDLIVLLNTDVVPEKNFLTTVLPHFKKKNVFGVSFHEKNYGAARCTFEDGYISLRAAKENDQTQQCFYVSGGSGIFRKSIWQELSGMDEKLFTPFYWEDIDLSYRAQKRGYLCLWEPSARVTHVHESTMSKLPKKKVGRIRERNQLLMIWKNIHSPSMLKKHLGALSKRASRHPGYLVVVFMAIFKLKDLIRLRKKEIRESKVSDEAVFAKFS